MAKFPDGYLIKIFTCNNGGELEKHLNEFINSGIASEIDDNIQFYLNIAYVRYKPAKNLAKMNVYKYEVDTTIGIVLASTPEEAETLLRTHSISGASITPVAVITAEPEPRIL